MISALQFPGVTSLNVPHPEIVKMNVSSGTSPFSGSEKPFVLVMQRSIALLVPVRNTVGFMDPSTATSSSPGNGKSVPPARAGRTAPMKRRSTARRALTSAKITLLLFIFSPPKFV
jgi:hypothetical protein